jgi:hypothetical protein
MDTATAILKATTAGWLLARTAERIEGQPAECAQP